MKLRQILALGGGATLFYAIAEPYRIDVRRFDVWLENLPTAAQGLRVLQISDLHAGALQPRALRQKIIAAAKSEGADIVALTGDLLSRYNSYSRLTLAPWRAHSLLQYAEILARELEILRPPLGIFAVPGNHDFWRGSFTPVETILRAAGIQSLLNRAIKLENDLIVAGLDDLRVGNPDVKGTFAGVEAGRAQLILSHNPRAALLLWGRNSLVLSGHTHAGQVRLPLVRLKGFPVDRGESFFIDGFYNLGRAQLYVSRGAGTIHFPLRFRARPEIAVFTLKSAPK